MMCQQNLMRIRLRLWMGHSLQVQAVGAELYHVV